jgi:hypothetical protein
VRINGDKVNSPFSDEKQCALFPALRIRLGDDSCDVCLMPMAMMNVWEVGVGMGNRQVVMGVRVRLVTAVRKVVFVLVMLIVAVLVRVSQRFMRMLMLMPLAHMQPDSQRHQHCCDPE